MKHASSLIKIRGSGRRLQRVACGLSARFRRSCPRWNAWSGSYRRALRSCQAGCFHHRFLPCWRSWRSAGPLRVFLDPGTGYRRRRSTYSEMPPGNPDWNVYLHTTCNFQFLPITLFLSLRLCAVVMKFRVWNNHVKKCWSLFNNFSLL